MNVADQLLFVWGELDRAIKRIETSSVAELSTRVIDLNAARANMDALVTRIATDEFKKGLEK